MKFSIVIPTYNRETDLKECLNSILEQTILPTELIVIDDGELPPDFIDDWKNNFSRLNINLVYYKKNHEIERRGSSESRNKSLELINNRIFFILDDDVVLERSFCEEIIEIWQNNNDKNLIGVGGLIKNRRRKLKVEKIFNLIFGLNSKYRWDVNKVCFQVWDEEIKDPFVGYYAHGGVCSYDLEKVKELKFSTFSGGRTALEDVDFCLRAKNKGYKFIIQPTAQLYHYPSQTTREGQFLSGYKEGFNRKVLFKANYKKPSIFLKTWFYWANIGWILRQFLVGNWEKGRGLISGFLKKI